MKKRVSTTRPAMKQEMVVQCEWSRWWRETEKVREYQHRIEKVDEPGKGKTNNNEAVKVRPIR